MSHRVIFSPEAEAQLVALYRYIADAASSDIAARYTGAIVSYCESLSSYPLRGTTRDDVRPGLRITHYKGRAVIAFHVDAVQVSIIGVFYGGQDYETLCKLIPTAIRNFDTALGLAASYLYSALPSVRLPSIEELPLGCKDGTGTTCCVSKLGKRDTAKIV